MTKRPTARFLLPFTAAPLHDCAAILFCLQTSRSTRTKSANAQKNLQNGNMIVTPQFVGVASEDGKIPLQSITCRYDDSDLVCLSTLDSYGLIVKSYNWVNYGGDGQNESCWLDADNMEKAENVFFEPGQALWFEADSSENVLTSSGKVGTSDIAVQLQNGNTLTGNPTPVALNLQDIFCRYDDSDLVCLSTLDSYGLIVKSYNWVNYGGDGQNESCWLDADNMEKAVGVTFAPGEGLWVEGDSTDNQITFPAVELN